MDSSIMRGTCVFRLASPILLMCGMLAAQTANWPLAGQDLNGSRSQPAETLIGPSNVAQLAVKWTFTTAGDVSATPTVTEDTVYFPDWGGYVYAVDRATGVQRWRVRVSDINETAGSISRVSPAVSNGLVIFGDNPGEGGAHDGARVIAVDAETGRLRWKTRVDEHLAAQITASPVVAGGRVYVGVSSNEEALATNPSYRCCSFRGSMVALDASNGAVLWKTYTVPKNDHKPGGYSGGAIWGPAAVGNGLVYVGTGNNYDVPQSVKDCAANGGTDCLAPDDHMDSAVAFDARTGAIRWANRLLGYDPWTVACIVDPASPNCPDPAGPDYDFGSGPNLMGNRIGIGQKSGTYWMLDARDGHIIWSTEVGPGGTLGGIEWGTATDGARIYVEIGNNSHTPYEVNGVTVNGGSWAALDAGTGSILWQFADPDGAIAPGSVSVANGVLYAESFSGKYYAFNAATGTVLWSFDSGGSAIGGPSIANGRVFWGSGYGHIAPGTPNNKVYCFGLP